ncbi:MAG: FAD-binding protein [Candidatus Pacebacteria bacterium]|nr:FAD-binding protein [Candidatus Paceibacterota bacterium]
MRTWKNILQQACPSVAFRANEPLAHHTTVGIGGPAELFCSISTKQDLTAVLQIAIQEKIPITILGWGANTLIADRGITGLVIKNTTNNLKILDQNLTPKDPEQLTARWQAATADTNMPQFQDLDYDEKSAEQVLVEIDSGAALPVLIQKLVRQGITGLQWFTKIPATLGGAVVNNIHGGTHYISEFVESVEVLDASGNKQTLRASQLEFDYDYSRFHHTDEYLLTLRLRLYRGDQERAQAIITKWSRQKQKQPPRSLGCVFQNITAKQQRELALPTPSIGYLVDQELGLAGTKVGDAEISKLHAAFIVNTGRATASEYLAVMRQIHQAVYIKYNVSLKPEIFFKGFTQEELAFLTPL